MKSSPRNSSKGPAYQSVEAKLARTKKEAVSLSHEVGFPVALKIVSPNVIHKSDAGGVKLGSGQCCSGGQGL